MVFMVKASSLTYHAPISRTGFVHVRMWIERIGNTSVTYGFQVLSEDETVLHAEGSRVLISVDTATARPAPIPADERAEVEPLMGGEGASQRPLRAS
jgi:acyl-CoA thioester hydrolase